MLLGKSRKRNRAEMVLVFGRSMKEKCKLIFSDVFALVVTRGQDSSGESTYIYLIVLGLTV